MLGFTFIWQMVKNRIFTVWHSFWGYSVNNAGDKKMKRLPILIIILIVTGQNVAQVNSGALKFGFLNASSTGTGFIVGYEGGRYVDEFLHIGWSADWFHKQFVDKTFVDELNSIYGITGGEINELRAETNVHSLPLMISVTGSRYVAPRTRIFATGGVGAELMLIFYRDFMNPEQDDFQGAFDMNWRLGFGAIYEFGRFSELFGEVAYHHSNPSWTYEVDDPAIGMKRTYERSFDMSGIMMRVGVRFYW